MFVLCSYGVRNGLLCAAPVLGCECRLIDNLAVEESCSSAQNLFQVVDISVMEGVPTIKSVINKQNFDFELSSLPNPY